MKHICKLWKCLENLSSVIVCNFAITLNGNNCIKLATLQFEFQLWKTQKCLVERDQETVTVNEHCTPYFGRNVHMFIAVRAGIFLSDASL